MIAKVFKGLWTGLNFSRRLVLNLLFVLLVILFIVAITSDEDEIKVADTSVLRLNLNGPIVEEKTYVDPVEAAINDATMGNEAPAEILLDDIIEVIDQASKDERISVMLLDLQKMPSAHLNKLKQITDAIERFKAQNKQVIATGYYYTQAQYYIAAHADEIAMHPYGGVAIEGYGMYPLYFKDALEKLAVTQHIFRVGTFKSAVEPFIRNDMSDAAKEANRVWLGALWQEYKRDVAAVRPFDESNFDETMDELLTKMQAVNGDSGKYSLENQWVDSLKTNQQIRQQLIDEFMAPHTNKRIDEYGGSLENRMRLAIDTVKAVREKVSDKFLIIFRLSVVDLIPNGSTPDEVVIQAKALEQAGVDILNTGIGWHEARVPTIASMVPAGAFKEASKRLKEAVKLPVIAVNRINTPDIANDILNAGEADLISMARPLLADPDFFNKYKTQQSKQINICIGCNQGCLDHVFKGKRATCLVNPQAGFELDYPLHKTNKTKNVLVVGAGPAGLSASCYLAQKGHQVTLIDKKADMGGQFNLAMRIPGKEDFNHTLTYFINELERLNVTIELGKAYSQQMLEDYDDIVFATGVRPREASFECTDGKRVYAYDEVIRGEVELGKSIAILGAGGIGFDMVAFLTEKREQSISEFKSQWGIECEPSPHKDSRQLYMLKRSAGRFGSDLGKTTGWIHRQVAKQHGVKQIADCQYLGFNKHGLTISVGGEEQVLPVDTVIACIGQVSNNEELSSLSENPKVHVIGGAKLAAAIDAKRAIYEALQVARKI